jgi:hypothetical protein
MKRNVITAMLVVALVAAMAGNTQARPRQVKWEETQEYALPRGAGFDTDLPGVLVNYVPFDPVNATSVSLVVEDAAASAVIVKVLQGEEVIGSFCSRTSKPIRIAPYVPVELELFAGTCDGAPSFATSGVVRATFTGPKG